MKRGRGSPEGARGGMDVRISECVGSALGHLRNRPRSATALLQAAGPRLAKDEGGDVGVRVPVGERTPCRQEEPLQTPPVAGSRRAGRSLEDTAGRAERIGQEVRLWIAHAVGGGWKRARAWEGELQIVDKDDRDAQARDAVVEPSRRRRVARSYGAEACARHLCASELLEQLLARVFRGVERAAIARPHVVQHTPRRGTVELRARRENRAPHVEGVPRDIGAILGRVKARRRPGEEEGDSPLTGEQLLL